MTQNTQNPDQGQTVQGNGGTQDGARDGRQSQNDREPGPGQAGGARDEEE